MDSKAFFVGGAIIVALQVGGFFYWLAHGIIYVPYAIGGAVCLGALGYATLFR